MSVVEAEDQVTGSNKRQVRFVFVSDQATPVVLALDHYVKQCDACYLLATTSMKGKANVLKKELLRIVEGHRADTNVAVVPIEHGAGAVSMELTDLIEEQARKAHALFPDASLVFDLTGGTKLMALALYMVMERLQREQLDARASYTNTDADAFQWLSPVLEQHAMTNALDVRRLLEANGHEVTEILTESHEHRNAMLEREVLTRQVMGALAGDQVSCLNMWASKAEAQLKRNPHLKQIRVARDGNEVRNALPDLPSHLLKELKASGAVTVESGPKGLQALIFQSPFWVRYLNGIWLEEWAWLILDGTAGLRSCEMGVSLGRGDARNELDVVVSHRNRLLVLEAKTAIMAGAAVQDRAASVLYKIDSLARRVTPLFGTAVVLSWRALPQEALKRARDANITVIAPEEGQTHPGSSMAEALHKRVQEWMRDGKMKRATG